MKSASTGWIGRSGNSACSAESGFAQEIAADVDRHISAGVHGAEQDRRLGGRARAELDHRLAGAEHRRDLAAMAFEQGRLGARRIIFGEAGDLLEQFRAATVVEPARGHGRDRRGEAGEHVGAKGAGSGSRAAEVRFRRAFAGPTLKASEARRSPGEHPALMRIEEIAIARPGHGRAGSRRSRREAPSAST